jgi:hypothetical protein
MNVWDAPESNKVIAGCLAMGNIPIITGSPSGMDST